MDEGKFYEDIIQSQEKEASLGIWKSYLSQMLWVLVPNSTITPLSSSILICISFLQFLSLLVPSKMDGSEFIDIIQYFRIIPIISYSNSVYVYFFTLYFCSCFVLVLGLLLLSAIFFSNLFTYCFLKQIALPLFWVFYIPITECFFSIWWCNGNINTSIDGITCWQTPYYIHISLSGIIFILWIITSILITISCASAQNINNPFAHYPWNFELWYTFIRFILLAKNTPYLPKTVDVYITLVFDLIILIYCLYTFLYTFPYYNRIVSISFAASFVTLAIVIIYYIIIYLFSQLIDINMTGGNTCLICSFVVILPSSHFAWKRRVKILLSKKNTVNNEELDMQVHLLILGLFIKDVLLKDLFLFFQSFAHNSLTLSHQLDQEYKSILQQFIIYRLFSKNDLDINSVMLLQQARIHLLIFEDVYAAYLCIQDAEETEPGLLLEFELYCLKKEMMEHLKKRNKKEKQDFYEIFYLENYKANLGKLLTETAQLHLDFWSELKEKRNLNILHKLGKKIVEHNWKAASLWKKISETRTDINEAVSLYSSFLLSIIGDKKAAEKVIRKIEKYTEVITTKEQTRSKNSVSIIAFGSKLRFSIISSVSNGIKKVFGYQATALKGKKVTSLMPEIIAKHHNMMVKHNCKEKYMKGETILSSFGLNRNGFIFPIKVKRQQAITLKFGLLLISNIQVDSSLAEHNFILTDENGKLEGISKEVSEYLGITPENLREKEVNIKDICPTINEINLLELEGTQELTFIINNENLKSNEGCPRRRGSFIVERDRNGLTLRTLWKITTVKYDYINFQMKVFELMYISRKKVDIYSTGNLKTVGFPLEVRKRNSITNIFMKKLKKESTKNNVMSQVKDIPKEEPKAECTSEKFTSTNDLLYNEKYQDSKNLGNNKKALITKDADLANERILSAAITKIRNLNTKKKNSFHSQNIKNHFYLFYLNPFCNDCNKVNNCLDN